MFLHLSVVLAMLLLWMSLFISYLKVYFVWLVQPFYFSFGFAWYMQNILCMLHLFFSIFIFKHILSLYLRYVSYNHHIVGFYFFNPVWQSLMGFFSPFTFDIITDNRFEFYLFALCPTCFLFFLLCEISTKYLLLYFSLLNNLFIVHFFHDYPEDNFLKDKTLLFLCFYSA